MPQAEGERRAEREASAWFARLRTREISADTLRSFEAWRAAPQNDLAFSEMERVWRAGEGLVGSETGREALSAALQRAARPQRYRAGRPLVIGGAALTVGAAAVVVFLASTSAVPAPEKGQVLTTAVGAVRSFGLADGSSLTLDADSRAVVAPGPARQEVWLTRGRALFQVTHDATRPFRVHAGAAVVTDLGTRFDVELTRDAARVTLVSGQVDVARGSGPLGVRWRLTPGQALDAADSRARPTPADVGLATAWTDGRLVFHDTPLTEVILRANRYSARRLELADDASLAGLKVSGGFQAGDTEALLEALQDLYGLSATPTPGHGLVVHRSKAQVRDGG